MIVVSLLLILVAVTLLVLGLVGGSSALLISSIGASLLAAVALVIGARQASAARRTAGDRTPAEPFLPPVRRRETALTDDEPAAYAAGRQDADDHLTGPDATQPVDLEADLYDDDAVAGRTSSGQTAGPARPAAPSSADFDQATNLIGNARATDDDWQPETTPMTPAAKAGPRPDPSAGDLSATDQAPDDLSAEDHYRPDQATPATASTRPPTRDAATSPSLATTGRYDPDLPDDDRDAGQYGLGVQDDPVSRDSSPGRPAESDLPAADSAGRPDDLRGQADGPGDAAAAAEFDEPDPEDPSDEPLPQAVRPADAVRVARMDAEVQVVDGRPRYHLADCAHLVGRVSEGLPVAEAVELGFSPCGLCRPVDHLVAAAHQH